MQHNSFVVQAEKLVACVVLWGVLHSVLGVTDVHLNLLIVLETAKFVAGTHIFIIN